MRRQDTELERPLGALTAPLGHNIKSTYRSSNAPVNGSFVNSHIVSKDCNPYSPLIMPAIDADPERQGSNGILASTDSSENDVPKETSPRPIHGWKVLYRSASLCISLRGVKMVANWHAVGHCIRLHDLDNISLRIGQHHRASSYPSHQLLILDRSKGN
jgi:hypothetical protein